MKAAVVRSFGTDPRCEEIDPRELGVDAGGAEAGAEGVWVDVLAAALSPRVRSAAAGAHYTSRGALPLVPGVDGVGRLADGRRVYFVAAHDQLGAMAARTLAHPRLVAPLPVGDGAELDAAAVAALMLPAISSWVALTRRVALARGQRVLVLGATGTAGLAAVQIAKHLGAGHVVAAGRNGDALGRARSRGADQIVQLAGVPGDAAALADAASEVDIVLDYLWGSVAAAALPAICRRREDESRALRWIAIGSVAGDEVPLSSVLLRKRDLHVLGSGQGASSTAEMFAAAPAVLAAFASGALSVDVRAVPLADVARWWPPSAAPGERVVFVP